MVQNQSQPQTQMGLTVQEFKSALPKHLQGAASQELVDRINQLGSDPEAARLIRENIIGYTSVLKKGKFKTEEYVNAATYVSYRLMGYNNQDSYKRAFPQRYSDLVAKGCGDRTISAYVSMYNKGKLVNLILEQSLVPPWVMNHDVYQQAINTQLDLMQNAKSEKVRSDAANSILTHLKRPEAKNIQVDISPAGQSGMQEMAGMLTQLAQRQQELIAQGMNTAEVAKQKITVRADTRAEPWSDVIDVELETLDPVQSDSAPETLDQVTMDQRAAKRSVL